MIVNRDIVLGIHDKCFKLKKGEEIEVLGERDVYGRLPVRIQGEEVLVVPITLSRICDG